MKTISLTKGFNTIVDDDNFEFLCQLDWYALVTKKHVYAANGRLIKGKMVHILMHRMLLSAQHGELVDHKNRDTLDNRMENIRLCRPYENGANANMRMDNSTGFKGVSFVSKTGHWRAVIQCQNKFQHIGTFPNAMLAAQAYDNAARNLFGEFAATNETLGII